MENKLLDEEFWHTVKPQEIAAAIDEAKSVNIQDTNGWTPLHLAARRSTPEAVGLLLDRGANIDTRNEDGQTPLHLAAVWERPRIEVITLLLNRGADINARDNRNRTPLHLAIKKGTQAAKKILLDRGADAGVNPQK